MTCVGLKASGITKSHTFDREYVQFYTLQFTNVHLSQNAKPVTAKKDKPEIFMPLSFSVLLKKRRGGGGDVRVVFHTLCGQFFSF